MLCVFNPEHDLCLANGGKHYVPPASARSFAASSYGMMRWIYPSATCVSVSDVRAAYEHTGGGPIVPWGWNLTLKNSLLMQGVRESELPTDGVLDLWRRLQHRATLLPLQPYSRAVTSDKEVEELLSKCPDLLLKAPWSGSGRGLRWISNKMVDHDRAWLAKVVREQQCAIAEPRWAVLYDYALEYMVDGRGLRFIGFSLFDTANGVYRCNQLLSDNEIERRVSFPLQLRAVVEQWLNSQIVPHYLGPLGVDVIQDKEGRHHISEINLRHTMGLVAHEYLKHHPESEGLCFSAEDFVGQKHGI